MMHAIITKTGISTKKHISLGLKKFASVNASTSSSFESLSRSSPARSTMSSVNKGNYPLGVLSGGKTIAMVWERAPLVNSLGLEVEEEDSK